MAIRIDRDPAAVLAPSGELVEGGAVVVVEQVDPVRIDLIEHPEPVRGRLQAIGLRPRRLPEHANVVGHDNPPPFPPVLLSGPVRQGQLLDGLVEDLA